MFSVLLTLVLLPCFSSPKVFKHMLLICFLALCPFNSFFLHLQCLGCYFPELGSRSHGGSRSVLELLLCREPHPTPAACSSSLPRNGSGVVDHTVTGAVEMKQRERCRKRGVVTWASITYCMPTL